MVEIFVAIALSFISGYGLKHFITEPEIVVKNICTKVPDPQAKYREIEIVKCMEWQGSKQCDKQNPRYVLSSDEWKALIQEGELRKSSINRCNNVIIKFNESISKTGLDDKNTRE